MQYKYGRVLFGYEDSFDYTTLSKLIHDWLVNFKRVLVERNTKGSVLGVPSAVMPLRKDGSYDDSDLEKGISLWLDELDEMIFAFSDYEPEYKGEWFEGEDHGEKTDNGYKYNMKPTDPVEWDRYRDECILVEKRKEAGRLLFAKRFESLWW